MPVPDGELLVRIEPPLAWLIVNRPGARNALSIAIWTGLGEGIQTLAADSRVRVIIVHGAGEEAFMSGADITEFPKLRADAAMTAEYDRRTAMALAAIADAPQPVIAMINGLCFGGGCSVALACDLRFAADHARFAIPAARLGLAYPFERGVERLVHVVGPTHATDILLSARAFTADEALHVGFVNRVVDRDRLEAETREYAMRMAENAPLTLAAHKVAIREAMRASGARDLERVRSLNARCFDSADYQEGVAAFLAKRPPRFEGR
jgi:enoyl-CoA hydratase